MCACAPARVSASSMGVYLRVHMYVCVCVCSYVCANNRQAEAGGLGHGHDGHATPCDPPLDCTQDPRPGVPPSTPAWSRHNTHNHTTSCTRQVSLRQQVGFRRRRRPRWPWHKRARVSTSLVVFPDESAPVPPHASPAIPATGRFRGAILEPDGFREGTMSPSGGRRTLTTETQTGLLATLRRQRRRR